MTQEQLDDLHAIYPHDVEVAWSSGLSAMADRAVARFGQYAQHSIDDAKLLKDGSWTFSASHDIITFHFKELNDAIEFKLMV